MNENNVATVRFLFVKCLSHSPGNEPMAVSVQQIGNHQQQQSKAAVCGDVHRHRRLSLIGRNLHIVMATAINKARSRWGNRHAAHVQGGRIAAKLQAQRSKIIKLFHKAQSRPYAGQPQQALLHAGRRARQSSNWPSMQKRAHRLVAVTHLQ